VPYSAIHGVPEPHQFPSLPNDGTVRPELPAGTPYGIIGASSLYKRESFPGSSTPGVNYEGLEPFNSSQAEVINWVSQGADAGKYTNDQIAAIRILAMEPRPTALENGSPTRTSACASLARFRYARPTLTVRRFSIQRGTPTRVSGPGPCGYAHHVPDARQPRQATHHGPDMASGAPRRETCRLRRVPRPFASSAGI
jgi:hypothetical protein